MTSPLPPERDRRPSKQEWAQQIGWASSIGMTLVISTVIGLALGVGLDRWLGTKPVLTLLMLVLGIVAGFWNILKNTIKK